MSRRFAFLAIMMVVLAAAAPAMAAGSPAEPPLDRAVLGAFSLRRWRSALQPLCGSFGQGKGLAAACEAIGRNPGAVGPIRITMIIGLALIESLVIYALIIAFLLLP